MTDFKWNDYSLETQAIRAGHDRTHEDEHSMPIFATSSYVFNSAEEAALRFTGKNPVIFIHVLPILQSKFFKNAWL